MTIKQDEDYLTIRDAPVAFWVLGGFLLIGGTIAVACPLGLCSDATPHFRTRDYLALALGLSAASAGLFLIHKSPLTDATFRRGTDEILVRQAGLFRSRVTPYSMKDVAEVRVLEQEGTEGLGYQLNLVLHDGRSVPVSLVWAGNGERSQEAAEAIRRFLSRAGAHPPR